MSHAPAGGKRLEPWPRFMPFLWKILCNLDVVMVYHVLTCEHPHLLPLAYQWLCAEGSVVASQPSARMGWLSCSGRGRSSRNSATLTLSIPGVWPGWAQSRAVPARSAGWRGSHPTGGPRLSRRARELCLSPLLHGRCGAQGEACTVRNATSGRVFDDRAAVLAVPLPGAGRSKTQPLLLPSGQRAHFPGLPAARPRRHGQGTAA